MPKNDLLDALGDAMTTIFTLILTYPQNMLKIFLKYSQDMPEIRSRYAQDMAKKCQICKRYAKGIPKNLKNIDYWLSDCLSL